MLSTKAIGSAMQASHYFFNRDDYYSKEGELYERPSEWYGRGAALLDLKGIVDKKQFAELLAGKLPDGEQIGLMKNGTIKHRSGFDLTFSAPKSWSIANYETKDPIFDKLFEQSVKYTLDLIERDCAMANVYKDKKQHTSITGNIVASLHFHRLSRELDPQDHIHSVVKNMTQRSDGSWRALKSDDPKKMQHQYSEGFFERVNTRKKDYGAICRMYHAYLAAEAGFTIERTGDTFWELKHVSKEKITEFSTRREQILNDMELSGTSGGKAAAVSNLRTRAASSNLSTDEITAGINARLAKFPDKITIESLKQGSPTKINEVNKQEEARIAIKYAVEHLSEIAPSFSTAKLLACAMQHNFAKANIPSLCEAINIAKDKGLINSVEKANGDIVYISSANLNYEKQILQNFKESQNSQKSIVKSDNKFNKWIKKYATSLNAEQQDAIYSILRSKDRINAIDGYDNSDKTSLINILSKMANKSWYNPIVLAVSKNEAQELSEVTNANVKTAASYFKTVEIQENKNRNKKLNRDGEVLIIDGGHRLNTKQHEQLTKIAANNKTRVIHLYDSRQPENFQPGNGMQLLKSAGLNISNLSAAIKIAEPNTVEIKAAIDERTRRQNIAKDYIDYKIANHNHKIQIVTQNKKSADLINAEIQQSLKEQNLLGKNFSALNYNQRYLTTAQSKLAGQYRIDDLVSFSKDYISLEIKKEHYYKITDIDKKQNIVTLEHNDKRIYWDPNKIAGGREGVVKTYEVTTKEFYENDKIFVTKDFTLDKIFKGAEFSIGKVDDDKIELINQAGKSYKIKKHSHILAHLHLSYAKTASQSHNDKPDIVMAEQLAYKRQTNVKQFYKVVNQSKGEIKIYTDNKEAYLETLKRHNGETKPIVEMLLSKINKSVANISKDPVNEIDAAINKISKIAITENGLSEKYHKTLTNQKINNKNFTYTLLKYCIDNLSEIEAVFTKHSIESKMAQVASKFDHVIDISKLDTAIEKALNKNKLYQASLYGDKAYTTPRAVKLETKVLTLAKNTINNTFKFSSKEAVNEHLITWQENNTKLSSSQKTSIEKIVATNNGLILVNGLAGVGKTTMLAAIKPLADRHGIKMIGLAPTNAATNEIKDKGIESHTLDSYLGQLVKGYKEKILNKQQKTLLILDESSMASTEKICNLLTLTKNTNTRLAFVGDVAQLPAIEQGKMFWFLQNIGIETTHVKDIIRQKNSPEYLKLVKNAYSGDFKDVLSSMKKSGLAFDNKDLKFSNAELNLNNKDEMVFARINFMIDKLLQKPNEERHNTRVVTPANNECNLFNMLYRKELQHIGELSQNEVNVGILVNSNLAKHQKSEAIHYNINQVIKFNCNLTDTNIKKNDYLTIKNIDYKNNYLTLKNEKDEELALKMNQFKGDNNWKLTVFNQEWRSIAKGDIIRWRHTDKSKSRINMGEARVIGVDNELALLEDKKGLRQEIHFKNSFDKHWDHSYAGTAYTEQGKTAKHVAILMDSSQSQLASKPTFIVALTRAMQDGFIVTDDIEKFGKRLEITSGIKTSALESLNYRDCSKDKIKYTKTSPNIEQSKTDYKKEQRKPKEINRYNASELAQALSKDAMNVAISILGKPLKKTGINLFFGSNKGSLAVTISGKYQGTFKDFDTGDKGNMLTLIQQKYQLSFKETLEYAAKLVKHTPNLNNHNLTTVSTYIKASNNEISKYQRERIQYAQKLAAEAVNIKGTLAEKYLTQTRGIEQTKWPQDIKFHPGIYTKFNDSTNPALLIIARDKDNRIQAVQAIYLNPQTVQKADVDIKKQTFGMLKGALFCATNNANKSTAIICEGSEDALSIAKADPSKAVFACLGQSNFVNVPAIKMADFTNVVLALDNDGKKINEMTNIINAANKLQTDSNNIWLAQPNKVKEDYNDILKSSRLGPQLINNIINNAYDLKEINQDFKLDKSVFGNGNETKNACEIKSNIVTKTATNNLQKTKEIDLQI